MRAMPVPSMVAIGFVVLVILCIIAPAAGAVFGGVGAVVLLPYLIMATAKGNNRRFEAARTDLEPGEEARFWWKPGFPSMGARWVVRFSTAQTRRSTRPRVHFLSALYSQLSEVHVPGRSRFPRSISRIRPNAPSESGRTAAG